MSKIDDIKFDGTLFKFRVIDSVANVDRYELICHLCGGIFELFDLTGHVRHLPEKIDLLEPLTRVKRSTWVCASGGQSDV